jgi:hypothetical protein
MRHLRAKRTERCKASRVADSAAARLLRLHQCESQRRIHAGQRPQRGAAALRLPRGAAAVLLLQLLRLQLQRRQRPGAAEGDVRRCRGHVHLADMWIANLGSHTAISHYHVHQHVLTSTADDQVERAASGAPACMSEWDSCCRSSCSP